jgi:hypothetical protein
VTSLAAKAILVPSGDQAGSFSTTFALKYNDDVAPVDRSTVWITVQIPELSSVSVRTNAMLFPSGDQVGSVSESQMPGDGSFLVICWGVPVPSAFAE